MDRPLVIRTLDTQVEDQSGSPSDEALAAAALTDRRAFEALYLRHRLGLYRFARARTDDDEAAADVVATTFERAMVALPRYRPAGAGFRAWLYRIARNGIVDASRRRRIADRHASRPSSDAASHPSPEDDVLAAEDLARIRTLVSRLPDAQRDAVLLRYAGDLSTREIAATLGRSEAATRKLITRALTSLKEAYDATDR